MPKAVAVLKDAELRSATERVLHPDTHTITVELPGYGDVPLRPLPIKFARRLAAITNPVSSSVAKMTDEADFSPLLEMQDAFTEALCVLGQFYFTGTDKPTLNKEWIEDHLSSEDVRTILDKQLQVMGDNDFLLPALRQLLVIADQSLAVMRQNVNALRALATRLSTPASATPGTAPSTSSAEATPPAS